MRADYAIPFKDTGLASRTGAHWLEITLIDFGYMLTTDYSSTRLDNFEPIPATLIELGPL